MSLGPLDVRKKSSCLWLGDGRNGEELRTPHPNGWMVSRLVVSHHGFQFYGWGWQLCSRDLCVGLLIGWQWRVLEHYSVVTDHSVTGRLGRAVVGS